LRNVGKSTAEVADALGITCGQLYNWHRLLPESIRFTGPSKELNYSDEVIDLLIYIIELKKTSNLLKHSEIKKKVYNKMQNTRARNKKNNLSQLKIVSIRNAAIRLGVPKMTVVNWVKAFDIVVEKKGMSLNFTSEILDTLAQIKEMRENGIGYDEIRQALQLKQPVIPLNGTGRELADQINNLNEVIDKQEREKKDLRDRIATLENSLDNLLATISDLRNQQQPQQVRHVEPGHAGHINDTGKKWWAIKPLRKLLNGGM
jgi:DNA-binding transcriptional MerR regulator